MNITLKAGDKIYINGAVLRADRKVSLELLNDVNFLLESHVMQASDASTPLRQLYFVVQTLLMDPVASQSAHRLLEEMFKGLFCSFDSKEILFDLLHIQELVQAGRTYEALKSIRALYPAEATILSGTLRAGIAA